MIDAIGAKPSVQLAGRIEVGIADDLVEGVGVEKRDDEDENQEQEDEGKGNHGDRVLHETL